MAKETAQESKKEEENWTALVLDWLEHCRSQGQTRIILNPENLLFLRQMAESPVTSRQGRRDSAMKAGLSTTPQPQRSWQPPAGSGVNRGREPHPTPAGSKSKDSFSEGGSGTHRQKMIDVSVLDWEALEATVRQCRACKLAANRTNVVFGDGNRQAELMFIGEGPGADEDRQGLPFVGKAGMLLNKIIAAMGFTREEVYIANIVKCRPPNNRTPQDDEGEVCVHYLHRQIQLVKPRVIVLLGATSLRYLLKKSGLMRLRGTWLKFEGIDVMPTYHPAFLLRRPEAKREVWEDMKQVMAKLGRPVPEGGGSQRTKR